MAKSKESRTDPKTKSGTRWPILVPGILVVAVLVGLGTWLFLMKSSSQVMAAEYNRGPRLAVDRDLVDFGNVPFKKLVTARFHLRNVGDQPLVLAVDPRVEAIEGC
ncbi:MAG TPA: hypothetical protein VN203_04565 [Candidatus Acidoferrum sp.]|nr:hypothetical protein [Candidatus Acidoferrum sp.]